LTAGGFERAPVTPADERVILDRADRVAEHELVVAGEVLALAERGERLRDLGHHRHGAHAPRFGRLDRADRARRGRTLGGHYVQAARLRLVSDPRAAVPAAVAQRLGLGQPARHVAGERPVVDLGGTCDRRLGHGPVA
jgi:hypothetical protein